MLSAPAALHSSPARAELSASTAPEASTVPEEGPDPSPELDEPGGPLGRGDSLSCRRMTASGIVVTGLGLAAAGTGLALALRPDQVIPERPAFVISTRSPGVSAATIGAGLAVAGALMIIAGQRGAYRPGGSRSVAARMGRSSSPLRLSWAPLSGRALLRAGARP